MKPTIKLMLQAFVAIILLSTAVLPAYAQSERERERAENDRDLEERAFRLRMLEKSHNQPAKRRDPKLAFAQLQDDFVHIQLLNRRLVQAVAHGGALDLKFVAKSASEIRKRAERLMDNLALPEPERDSQPPTTPEAVADAEHLKRPILTLGKLIAEFSKNPFFTEIGVIDTQAATQVRRDLEEIIVLSDYLKKSSEKLSKAAQPSQ